MRFYRDSLIQDKKTEKEIIDELVKREADKDHKGRVMDYTGLGGRDFANFGFGSYEKFGFYKGLYIDMEDLSGREVLEGSLDTNNGTAIFLEDGFYKCRKPLLLP